MKIVWGKKQRLKRNPPESYHWCPPGEPEGDRSSHSFFSFTFSTLSSMTLHGFAFIVATTKTPPYTWSKQARLCLLSKKKHERLNHTKILKWLSLKDKIWGTFSSFRSSLIPKCQRWKEAAVLQASPWLYHSRPTPRGLRTSAGTKSREWYRGCFSFSFSPPFFIVWGGWNNKMTSKVDFTFAFGWVLHALGKTSFHGVFKSQPTHSFSW